LRDTISITPFRPTHPLYRIFSAYHLQGTLYQEEFFLHTWWGISKDKIPTPMSVSLVDIPYPFFPPSFFPYINLVSWENMDYFFGAHALCTVTPKEQGNPEMSTYPKS
jgi:hypothetical protein